MARRWKRDHVIHKRGAPWPRCRTHFGAGVGIVGSTPQEFDAHIRAELAKWLKVAKETGIKADL